MNLYLPDWFNITLFYLTLVASLGGTYLVTKHQMEKVYDSKKKTSRLIAFLFFLMFGTMFSLIAANMFVGIWDTKALHDGFGFKALPVYLIAAFIGWGKSTDKTKQTI